MALSFNITPFADVLGDPDDYFVDHEGRETPLVVRHSTGDPEYALVIAGSDGGVDLVPYADWLASRAAPAPSAAWQAVPGRFEFAAHVQNPGE